LRGRGLFGTRGIGAGATIGNLIDTRAFNGSGSLSFTEANLPSGVYYVILAITSANAVWTGSSTPTVFTAPNVTHSIDYKADTIDSGFPPDSNFTAITVTDRFYQLTIPGPSTPEPGTLLLAGAGLIALIASRRQRARSRG